jgi:hypothetical protein
MYTLLRQIVTARNAVEQLTSLTPAWLVAEFFYKFHSFTLECAAFLATWFVLDAVVQIVARRVLGAPTQLTN